jgi:hypothetical protein
MTAKFYILFLLAASVYSTYSLARIRLGLHKLPNRVASTDSADVGLHLNEITGRLATLRQLHMSLLLLFGVCCANEVFATLRAIQYSLMSLSSIKI